MQIVETKVHKRATNDPVDGLVVHLGEIRDADPSLAEVADLPLGWIALRDVVGGP